MDEDGVVTPPDQSETPGGAAGPHAGGAEAVETPQAVQTPQAVHAVVDELGPPERVASADPDHSTDRLARVDEAHRRLRRLLELPDA